MKEKLIEQLEDMTTKTEGLLQYCKENYAAGILPLQNSQIELLRLLIHIKAEEIERLFK
jgi:hypothetical protein